MPSDKQRREAERRRLQRQLQRRAERAAVRRRNSLIATVAGVVVIVAVVLVFVVTTGDDDKSTKQSASSRSAAPSTSAPVSTPASSSSSSSSASYPCTWTKDGSAAKKASVPSTTTPPRTGTTAVAISTNRGPMTFTLDRKAAPCAVASFVSLAKQNYFNSTPCHRLTSGSLSVLQCGDPTGTGSGGPGYKFNDELTGKEKYTRGVLAMANSGPNTNGSQFFIVYKNSTLGPQYTVFGHVTQGLGVVDKVAAAGSTPANDGKPKLAITITKAAVA